MSLGLDTAKICFCFQPLRSLCPNSFQGSSNEKHDAHITHSNANTTLLSVPGFIDHDCFWSVQKPTIHHSSTRDNLIMAPAQERESEPVDFETILNTYLISQTSFEDTIAQIATPIEASYMRAEPGDEANQACDHPDYLLWDLWAQIFKASKSISYTTYLSRFPTQKNQRSFIPIVAALRSRPTPALSADKLEAVKDYEPWSFAQIWENLYSFDWQAWSTLSGNGPHTCGIATDTEWINLNAFLADLSANSVYGDSFCWIAYDPDDDSKQSSTSLWVLEQGAFGAAAVWVILSAREWWNGGKPLNKTRLKQWRDRLVKAEEEIDMDDEIQELVEEAIEVLKELKMDEGASL